jgi:hypothetical protein
MLVSGNPSDELRETLERYLALRQDVDDRKRPWSDLVVFIDPAWGRVEGIEGVREFLVDSMTGIEDWTFPVDKVWVDGDEVGIKYRQVLPGGRQQSAYTTLIYAGGGRFRYEEDVLNMAHCMEDLGAIGWQPPTGMKFPPAQPNRDFSRPE